MIIVALLKHFKILRTVNQQELKSVNVTSLMMRSERRRSMTGLCSEDRAGGHHSSTVEAGC